MGQSWLANPSKRELRVLPLLNAEPPPRPRFLNIEDTTSEGNFLAQTRVAREGAQDPKRGEHERDKHLVAASINK